MWFPSKTQWGVMWLGLAALFLIGTDTYGHDVQQLVPLIAITVATLFVVWMIEGRRRKP